MTARRVRRAARPVEAAAPPVLPSPLVGAPVMIRGVVAHAVEPDGQVCVDTGRGFLWASRADCGLPAASAFTPDPDLFG